MKTYLLTLKAEPSNVPEAIRLRRLLKCVLRGFGFRCVDVALRDESPVLRAAGRQGVADMDRASAGRPAGRHHDTMS